MLAEKYPSAVVTGIDAHTFSVQVAQKNLESRRSELTPLSNVRFEHRPVSEMHRSGEQFDVITTTFVNHHIFPDDSFVDFLRYIRGAGRQAFIFNDFHRSLGCYTQTALLLETVRRVGAGNLRLLTDWIGKYRPHSQIVPFARSLLDVLADGRPGRDLFIEGGVLSVARSFTKDELRRMLGDAGYPQDSLECISSQFTCRTSCVVKLSLQ
jgi:hypothetical protein